LCNRDITSQAGSAIINKYAKRVNPQMQDVLHDHQYYWVSARGEYSTDILFKRRQDLCQLYRQHVSAQPGQEGS